jgi:CheY-like chemotaxis protein
VVREEGPCEWPPAQVLEHAGVDREGVIPALAIQDLEKHHPVAEKGLQTAIKHLDDVGLCDAAAQLVDELGRRFRRDRFLQASTRLEPGGGGRGGRDSRGCGSRVALQRSTGRTWHCHRYTNPVPFTPPKPIAPTPEDLRGSTVLVVDDERAWRVILETDLRMLGYKVSMAEDADQALEKAQSDQPEVAIIDLMLPEPMDGWGLLNELRARGQKVPVIFYTAYPVFPSGTDDPDVVGYMSKAIDRADLYALLPPAIRRSRERRNSDS